ncbi:MAG: UDP-glucose 4-epimerase GalE [Bacillota bacterium]
MILVTGGAGYIGSHAVKALLDKGCAVAVFDNLSYGHAGAIDQRAEFIRGDLQDPPAIRETLQRYPIRLVMHFAAHSIVPESVLKPLLSYRNVSATVNLLSAMAESGVKRLVFSSTAAVYGEPVKLPIEEDHPINPTNPYGESKACLESMLARLHRAAGLNYVSLRYFNAAGADPDGALGEDHHPETHLIPLVLKTALGQREKIFVYGSDYPTEDGTAVRDYIHVSDLVEAHLLAMHLLEKDRPVQAVYNLGHQKGYSVLEVIETARRITKREIPLEMASRRPGDPSTLIAASDKIKKELGWKPRFTALAKIIATAWEWHLHHPNGY